MSTRTLVIPRRASYLLPFIVLLFFSHNARRLADGLTSTSSPFAFLLSYSSRNSPYSCVLFKVLFVTHAHQSIDILLGVVAYHLPLQRGQEAKRLHLSPFPHILDVSLQQFHTVEQMAVVISSILIVVPSRIVHVPLIALTSALVQVERAQWNYHETRHLRPMTSFTMPASARASSIPSFSL